VSVQRGKIGGFVGDSGLESSDLAQRPVHVYPVAEQSRKNGYDIGHQTEEQNAAGHKGVFGYYTHDLVLVKGHGRVIHFQHDIIKEEIEGVTDDVEKDDG